MVELAPGEEWLTWEPDCGETWDEFMDNAVGDTLTLIMPDGKEFAVLVTQLDLANQQVAFMRVAGDA